MRRPLTTLGGLRAGNMIFFLGGGYEDMDVVELGGNRGDAYVHTGGDIAGATMKV